MYSLSANERRSAIARSTRASAVLEQRDILAVPIGAFVSDEDADALTPAARASLGDRVLAADLYSLEQQTQNEVANEWWRKILNREVSVSDLLADHVVRELHRSLYAHIWEWGGRQRSRETNIGIDPAQIGVQMRTALDDLAYQWARGSGLTPRTLGIATHAALVHIHPFADGNGRVTRLMADLVYLAAQDDAQPLRTYDWSIDRPAYIRLLGDYDRTRDTTALAAFVPVVEIKEEADQ